MGLLHVADQEYLGCSLTERDQIRGILPGNDHESVHRVSLPWWIHHRPIDRDNLDGQEGSGWYRVSEATISGGLQAPAFPLHRIAEVTPT